MTRGAASGPAAGSDPTHLAVYTDTEDVDVTPGIELLRAHGYRVRHLHTQNADEIVAGAADAHALLVGYAQITGEMMDGMPSLGIIAIGSVGYDNVDVDAARDRGIWVTNAPGIASEEVATHALSLALAIVRDLTYFTERTATGGWFSRRRLSPPRLSGETLGVVGIGRIGTSLARQAAGIFGAIVAYDPYLPDTPDVGRRLADLRVRRVGLNELLETSMVVSLHVPLTQETHCLIDAEALTRMQPGGVLINVSRGKLIDSVALAAALDSGRIRGAGLDVLDVEPPPSDHPLVRHPRVLLTPHVAYLSESTMREYVRVQAQNVVSLRQLGRPDNPLFDPPGQA